MFMPVDNFLAQLSVYPSKFSAASLRYLSPGGTTSSTDDLLWDTDKGKQKYSPLHPVCGSTVGSGPLSPKLHGELWLAERMQWRMKGEPTREWSFLSSAMAGFYSLGQPRTLGCQHCTSLIGCCPQDFPWNWVHQAGQTCMQVPHHTNFLCPEPAPYYQRLGSSVQLLAR